MQTAPFYLQYHAGPLWLVEMHISRNTSAFNSPKLQTQKWSPDLKSGLPYLKKGLSLISNRENWGWKACEMTFVNRFSSYVINLKILPLSFTYWFLFFFCNKHFYFHKELRVIITCICQKIIMKKKKKSLWKGLTALIYGWQVLRFCWCGIMIFSVISCTVIMKSTS